MYNKSVKFYTLIFYSWGFKMLHAKRLENVLTKQFTVTDLSKQLDCTRNTVYNLLKTGEAAPSVFQKLIAFLVKHGYDINYFIEKDQTNVYKAIIEDALKNFNEGQTTAVVIDQAINQALEKGILKGGVING